VQQQRVYRSREEPTAAAAIEEGVVTSTTAIGGMGDFSERIRLVILGGAGVGKSCIVKRFLFGTYSDRYRSTVEDLYYREYDLGSVTLKVIIYFLYSPEMDDYSPGCL
jgi:hypothetical protein